MMDEQPTYDDLPYILSMLGGEVTTPASGQRFFSWRAPEAPPSPWWRRVLERLRIVQPHRPPEAINWFTVEWGDADAVHHSALGRLTHVRVDGSGEDDGPATPA